ncbi:hypothetical protein K438DRAFT_1772991 [Mycena galopus ATCC 62051]|nr:hypothetical protein K438DRAFT_1772991 [Mycena galopus ATCC 62051]
MPLAADTPEATLIAGVGGQCSPITITGSKQLGDSVCHPTRTAAHTLSLLQDLEAEAHPWEQLADYVKAAKKLGLNGVHESFWRDWSWAEPSIFLMPEVLHYWLKFFYNHLVKWCIEALRAEEIDFCFSVLHPHTGMCHFKEGILKAKQTTGREHRDIMHYIVPIIAGGVAKKFVKTIASLDSFFYHGQAEDISEWILEKIDNYLQSFHDNKQAILDAGARRGKKGPIENWCLISASLNRVQTLMTDVRKIPKLSANVTEHGHIQLVKCSAENSNNQNHEDQICWHLDRKDKIRHFNLATAMARAGIDFGEGIDPEKEEDIQDDMVLDDEPSLLLNSTSKLLAQIDPVQRLSGTNRACVNYFLTSKLLAEDLPWLRICTFPKGCKPLLEESNLVTDVLPFDKVECWDKVRMQSHSFHKSDKILVPETVNVSPLNSLWKFGRADTWCPGKINGLHLELKDFLVHQQNPAGPGTGAFPDPLTGMYLLKRAQRGDNSPKGDIFPLNRLRAAVELTPHFRKKADTRLTKETSLDHGEKSLIPDVHSQNFLPQPPDTGMQELDCSNWLVCDLPLEMKMSPQFEKRARSSKTALFESKKDMFLGNSREGRADVIKICEELP